MDTVIRASSFATPPQKIHSSSNRHIPLQHLQHFILHLQNLISSILIRRHRHKILQSRHHSFFIFTSQKDSSNTHKLELSSGDIGNFGEEAVDEGDGKEEGVCEEFEFNLKGEGGGVRMEVGKRGRERKIRKREKKEKKEKKKKNKKKRKE